VTTNSSGQWSQSGFEEGTPYQLTPSSANYTFTPASQNFSYDSMQPEVINLQAGGGSQTATISVTAPPSGANWQTGSTQAVSWTYTGNPGSTVELLLLQGGNASSAIASSVSIGSDGAGSYSWAIPSNQAAGSNYQVQVASTSTASCSSTSSNFTISAPAPSQAAISVTAPPSGANWQASTTQTISWTYTGSPGSTVNINLLSGGSIISAIASSVSIGSDGAGSYSWAIPSNQAAGSNYQVQVASTSTASCSSTSSNFTISAPAPSQAAISVIYPRSGLSFPKGQYYLVYWEYTGNPGPAVRIDLLQGGSLYQTIVPSTSAGRNGYGHCYWYISNSQKNGYNFQIRITSTSNPAITGTSGTFTIG
jgi:hypothetical protein